MTAFERYTIWCERAADPGIKAELAAIKGNESEIKERFYDELQFGTAGLRGVIGAGSARMNIYTVGKATQGFARYLAENYKNPSVAISFDSRHKSYEFSRLAAGIFAANGVKVYLYETLQPTPVLSYTVRELKCSGGVMITASHNPSVYNGYKAYDKTGCQLSVEESDKVLSYIEQVDPFSGVKSGGTDITMLSEPMVEKFLDRVYANSVHPGICKGSGLHVVYTPLNGTGKVPVLKLFERLGVTASLVPSQAEPNGDFPTCPYPNPEFREALEEGLKVVAEKKADILIATDPDADRLGTAVPDKKGGYTLITGNEMGCLMFDYMFSQRITTNTMPKNPVAVKTIVTTTMADAIGAHYGVEIRNVFTGFKYICGVASEMESRGEADRFLMGFEESYGYTIGSHVRDKDAVVSTMFVCEMAAFYKKQGKDLLDRLAELYAQYGCYRSKQKAYVFEGVDGMDTMAAIMKRLRTEPLKEAGGEKVVGMTDYLSGVETDFRTRKTRTTDMESSDVLSYLFEDGTRVIVRPSGTEPKLKTYFLLKKSTFPLADEATERYEKDFERLING